MSESENEKIIRGLDKMGFVQCDHSKSPSGSFNNAMYQAGIKTFKRSGVLLGGHTKYVLVYKGKYIDRPKTTLSVWCRLRHENALYILLCVVRIINE